jgi:hypothetical protein
MLDAKRDKWGRFKTASVQWCRLMAFSIPEELRSVCCRSALKIRWCVLVLGDSDV